MILLGWEIGTGKRVEIPDTGHLAWFGQTQLSGKTTALEAIAFRGGLRAVAFITKQGEGGFLTGRMIPPYFSEPTNDEEQPLWRWVKSILEASQQRKMNFEESWLIKCCEEPRRATTLAEVHENIKALLSGEFTTVVKGKGKRAKTVRQTLRKPVSGINAGVYTSLKAYFDIVMPQLARLPYTKKLEIGPGLNVMNLSPYAMETQALVIRSVAEWIYLREKGVRMIIPECQDFIPQGKNSPVKMAAENFIRKGAANKNFMWFDSQDMAAVDKLALRACSIVGIGVQTEMHEIDRALGSTFNNAIRPVDIARLKIGEFYVRTSGAQVTRCYVQPAWMDSEVHAQAIAKGEETSAGAKEMLNAFKRKRDLTEKAEKAEKTEKMEKSLQKGKPSSPAYPDGPPQMLQIQIQEPPEDGDQEGDDDETNTANQSERGDAGGASMFFQVGPPTAPVSGASLCGADIPDAPGSLENETSESEEVMPSKELNARMREYVSVYWKEFRELPNTLNGHRFHFAEAFLTHLRDYDSLIEAHDALADQVLQLKKKFAGLGDFPLERHVEHGAAVPGNNGKLSQTQEEIYKYVIKRAENDPAVLALLTRRPELRVKVERSTIQMDDSTIIGRIARLIHDGYFAAPKNGPTVQKELKRRGCDQPTTNLYKPLNKLTEMGFLTLETDGFQAVPEMKVQIEK